MRLRSAKKTSTRQLLEDVQPWRANRIEEKYLSQRHYSLWHWWTRVNTFDLLLYTEDKKDKFLGMCCIMEERKINGRSAGKPI
jgi:hypothetical protein